ncbi:protein kinase-like domain, concanavalin A-like lectin/glucanase domain protein [Tanacetum coccineum]|uniref:Protein kinase-like domain, concanavalin A-like lectin/glucanase domain protein n=1 Tax=Tanacetum coccineum TaxID=301880 RepID=A0ABQ4WCB9_9ASTR
MYAMSLHYKNIIQAETIRKMLNLGRTDEFINIFSTPVQEQGEPSSRHVDTSNMHTFYRHHLSAQRWTKDHPLEQVIGNPSESVRTRHQLETDGEMKELHQFDLTRCMGIGYAQKEGIDFEESFAPVARLEAVRFVHLRMLQHIILQCTQLDVKTTFRDGTLKEEVLPSKKAVYGLTSTRALRKPDEKLITAGKSDLSVLKDSINMSLCIRWDHGFELTAFSVSDHALSDYTTALSMSPLAEGSMVFIGQDATVLCNGTISCIPSAFAYQATSSVRITSYKGTDTRKLRVVISSTPNSEFLDPKKKLEIESWLEDSKIVDPLVSSDDVEYFDTFPALGELGYHEWLLKYPKPSWVKAKIRTENLNNIKISCMIGHFLKREAYINLESPINVMSKQHYKWIMSKGIESRQKPSNPEDTTSIIDHQLRVVVFGKPFVREIGLVYDQEEGTVVFKKDNEKITFKMPHKMEKFNHIDFKDVDTNSIPPLVLDNNDNHGKTYYSDSLILGPEYREDESIRKETRHLTKLEREAWKSKGEVTSLYGYAWWWMEMARSLRLALVDHHMSRKSHLLEDKQIPSIGVFDEDRKAIGSKWIYKIKYRPSGEIDRYKARLVAQGFVQKEGTDNEETFSPVVKMVTVRYDIIITDNNIFEIEKFKVYLKSKFMIKDLGKLKYFLSIEVIDTDKGICLNQRKYVLDLLSEYGMLVHKPAKTPLMSKLIISNEASDIDHTLDNITDYQKLMGKLIYLTNTRPDIFYVVHCLSHFMHSPLQSHLKTAFKILRYLKGCPGLGIHFVKDFGMSLKAFSDAD